MKKNIIKTRKISALITVVLCSALLFTGCGNNRGTKITVVGSTSVEPLAQDLAYQYTEKHNNLTIEVQGVGSTAGIKSVKDGTCDIGTASRELTDEEKKWNLNETVIAIDGIAVIVSPDNSVGNLTIEQILKIFKGEIKNWSEVGGDDKEIIVVSREDGSGTRGAFEEFIGLQEKKDGKTISLLVNDALTADGNGAVMANVAGKQNAIGYMSIGMVDETKVKKLKVNGVEATEENLKNKKYEISRPFLMITKGEPSKDTEEFIDFILSDEGQEVVLEDYISVK